MIARKARNWLQAAEARLNRARGRSFIPSERMLSIETSSACNLKCRFCAYTKKQGPKVSMPNALFRRCVEQAVELGYRAFELTPCTGDIFMDRGIRAKLEFLDRHPEVDGFQFFCNFTIPKPDTIEHLFRLQKLRLLTISIYGQNPASFVAVTDSTEKVYERLLRNLETLRRSGARPFTLQFSHNQIDHRDNPSYAPDPVLMDLLESFERDGCKIRRSSGNYNNWGGYITDDDVRGLPIRIKGPDYVHKNGACALLFTSVQVMATGIVNGCACRDVDATLRIGDVNQTPLREIISLQNPLYVDLIAEQQRGEFRPICRSCDFYKSIYHARRKHRRDATALETLEQFEKRLRVRAPGATATTTA